MLAVLVIAASELFVTPAVRCNECHEKMVAEWKGSAHARSAKSAAFVAMRALAPDPLACDRCHAPLRSIAVPPALSGEGVTCDVCHTLSEVTPTKSGATLTLHADDNVKYGPLCDAKAHYFHKMGCSPLHERSQLCGGCHWLDAVYTEYSEWSAAKDKDGAECQGCHMPGASAEVAKSAGVRKKVPHHGLLGKKGDLFSDAASLVVHLSESGGEVTVETELTNDGAGHAIPAGHPGRRLVLSVRSLDEQGAIAGEQQKEFARIYRDADGKEAPFFLATQHDDTRLLPNATDRSRFTIAVPKKGALSVQLVRRTLGADLAARLQVPVQEDVLLAATIKRPFPKSVTATKGAATKGRGR
jgi:hypothetical protein